MLIFLFKKKWYEKVKSGRKTIIYRKVTPHLAMRIAKELCRPMLVFHSLEEVCKKVSALGFKRKFDSRYLKNKNECILRVGHTRKNLTAYITLIEVVDGKDTDLYIDKPVYEIHFSNVKEAAE